MTRSREDDRRKSLRAALIAAAFFALGLVAARLLGVMSPAEAPSQRAAPSPSAIPAPPSVEDAGGPRIFFDPASISLLPDASLHVEILDAPDAGASAR